MVGIAKTQKSSNFNKLKFVKVLNKLGVIHIFCQAYLEHPFHEHPFHG
jgi:hypothetical protein